VIRPWRKRKGIPVDLQRVAAAALQAALEDGNEPRKRRLSAGKAVALGAVVVTAGRLAAGRGGQFVRTKLEEHFPLDEERDEPDDEAYEEDEAYEGYDEPEDEGYDEPEDEGYDEPEDEEPEPPEGGNSEEPEAEELDEPEDEEPEQPQDEDVEEPEGGEAEEEEPAEDEQDEEPEEEPAQPAARGAGDSSRPTPQLPIFDKPSRRKSKTRPAKRPPGHPPSRQRAGGKTRSKERTG
jgi:hypothetical protein